jgi:uncharacterized OsmC-like protein
MCADEMSVTVELKQKDRYRFLADFGLPNVPPLEVDEDPPLGCNSGPDPSRLLAVAVAHCMVSSLLFCLEKSRIGVKGIDARAKAYFGRNEENRLRINRIELKITAEIPDNEKANIDRCKSIFEKYCTVSQSIRSGIPIEYSLDVVAGQKGG